jgi:hypothetical protein
MCKLCSECACKQMHVQYLQGMFFFSFISLLVGYLGVASLTVLRTVSKLMDTEIMELHPKAFTLTHTDVWCHLSSYSTVDQVFWVLQKLQHSKKLIPHMRDHRTALRALRRYSADHALSEAVFCALFVDFRYNKHTLALVSTAIKFDSLPLLRLIAKEVSTRTYGHPRTRTTQSH